MANPTTPEDTRAAKNAEDESDLDRSFAAALRAAETAPDSEDAWNHIEDLADKLQRPDEVAAVYRSALDKPLSKDVFAMVSERAYQFHDEWFGDTPDKITGILGRIIELDGGADWAFERLSVMLHVDRALWSELLDLYDKTLAATLRTRRSVDDCSTMRLRQPKTLPTLRTEPRTTCSSSCNSSPSNEQLVHLARAALARDGRSDTATSSRLWESRAFRAFSGEAARKIRVQRRGVLVGPVGRAGTGPRRAARARQREPRPRREPASRWSACSQLEGADLSIRQGALSLVAEELLGGRAAPRTWFVSSTWPLLASWRRKSERPIHRELGTRLAILGRDIDALGHYRSLLIADPTDADARKQIRRLAQARPSARIFARRRWWLLPRPPPELNGTPCLLEAGHLHRSTALEATPDRAIDLYCPRAFASEEAEDNVALTAAHNLNELSRRPPSEHEERLAGPREARRISSAPVRCAASCSARLPSSPTSTGCAGSRAGELAPGIGS